MSSAPYIELISCCDSLIILNFKTPNGFENLSPSYQYTGITENGLVNGGCYTITQKIGTISFVLSLPTIDSIYLTDRTGCEDAKCACSTPCYTLYSCDGNYFNTTTDLSANVDTYIRIEESDKTWYVIGDASKTTCNNALDVTLDLISPIQVCTLKCYQITGNPATVTYMNADYDIVTVIGSTKICSYITPIVTGTSSGFVVELGDCVDEECPEICFEFTNCQTSEVLVVSNSPSIIPYYAQNQYVTLDGYEGCWTIDIANTCNCPVSVTILKAFDGKDCSVCLPIVNYKFTNCNNQSIIKYSTEDYSSYVGKTVKLECGECWFVSEIDYIPPSTQPINITFTFDSCEACTKDYYKLTNCIDPSNVIYTSTPILIPPLNYTSCNCVSVTYTTLNGVTNTVQVITTANGPYGKPLYEFNGFYLYWITDGGGTWIVASGTSGTDTIYSFLESTDVCPFGNYTQSKDSPNIVYLLVEPCATSSTVTIKECEGCWTATKTNSPINPTNVTLIDQFIDCAECYKTIPCICSTITNQDIVEHTYSYLDCEFNQSTVTLQAGETSDRVCVIKWLSTNTSCDCITLLATAVFESESQITDFWVVFYPTTNLYNGKTIWISEYVLGELIGVVYMYWDITTSSWFLAQSVGNNVFASLPINSNCPIGSWIINSNDSSDTAYDTINCSAPCNCIIIKIVDPKSGDYGYFEFLITSEIRNGYAVYNNIITPNGVYAELYYDGTKWVFEIDNKVEAYTLISDSCPISNNWIGTYGVTESNYCTTNTNSSLDKTYIEYFGDCTNGECPPLVYSKRKVKPGYSTPTCDIEKYEKITCKSSEILYKEVMRLRYGISNCCPEEDTKWLIKKELIDLDALKDPDYICKPTTSCCNQPITSCGCDCNSTLKTCNS